MSNGVGRASRPFGLPRRLLLVLAVLTGLLAMHGLGPGGIPAQASMTAHAETVTGAATASTSTHRTDRPSTDHAPTDHSSTAPCACPHDGPGGGHGGGPGGGHAEHADPTCAASGISGPPVLSVPAVVPGTVDASAAPARGLVPTGATHGRAPPSLSELQLLRV
ncbi:DUF6153 family protein [Streptomyces sp. RerS4]|uniref:DUF6153 family protein n=1 Tax=Streptomyces sp. RerS4 TaxID=2942449 RepID=UPI00201BF8E5|nr:DUF6153 family protein [Streptomyces sp. RerS4]UQX03999.1 DUF6153 family protein [Streptomyces sp. RerS4]